MAAFSKQHLKYASLLAGIAVAAILYFINPFHVSKDATLVLAIGGLMIIWWVTEALPMPVVALLPLILFPLLKINSLEDTAAPYANEVIFLFMGGFMLGLAIEKWNLHRRIALNIVRVTGTSGDRIVLGFILASGLLSMWLSNTATTMMMFPIALSVIHVMKENHKGEGNMANFSLAIMLVIAYASNIGGVATIIGTPPNVAYVNHIRSEFKYELGFGDWMLLCMPLSILLLFCLYWVAVKWLFPNRIKSDVATRQHISEELHKLGHITPAEVRVMLIFIMTALLWIFREPVINRVQDVVVLNDTIIALICAVALFICPSGMSKPAAIKGGEDDNSGALLEWSDTSKMAWGILLLFGGGISLANAMGKVGLIEDLGKWLAGSATNGFMLILLITTISVFISEVMSNVAQVIVMGPVVSALALELKIDPLVLGIPMTLGASCAGMLPMGTPPNAIVFASGHIKLKHMTKAGFVMNIVAILLISLFSWFFVPLLMRIP